MPPKRSFVHALLDDQNQPRSVRAMRGWAAAAPTPGRLRVYRDAALATWIEFDEAAVLHREADGGRFEPNGVEWIWVPSDTPLVEGSQAAQARAAAHALQVDAHRAQIAAWRSRAPHAAAPSLPACGVRPGPPADAWAAWLLPRHPHR